MNDVKDNVIVTVGATSQGVCVHHHDFPEVRAEGPLWRCGAWTVGSAEGSGSLAERQRIFLVADDWPASGTEPGGAPPSAT